MNSTLSKLKNNVQNKICICNKLYRVFIGIRCCKYLIQHACKLTEKEKENGLYLKLYTPALRWSSK